MASDELCGATTEELEDLESEYYETELYQEHSIPFEVRYCLMKIGRQPEWYDGPQRYCTKRTKRRDEDEFEGDENDIDSFCSHCHIHGGDAEKNGAMSSHRLENPRTITITHGTYAEDEHLMMDFTDEEQELFDRIMDEWPEIYDWPARSEDPARYRILRRVAVNEVRASRQEDYLDGNEVHDEPVYDDNGVRVDTKDAENPLAREYRLLMSEVTNQMKELGLTPKERQKMDTLSSEEDRHDAITEIAGDALDGDGEYDPEAFDG